MTIWCGVARDAVIISGVVKTNIRPRAGDMTGYACIQVVLIWRRVAQGAVRGQEDMVYGRRRPGRGDMAVCACRRIMRCRRFVTVQAFRVAGMVKANH